jgi:hypothetical protein
MVTACCGSGMSRLAREMAEVKLERKSIVSWDILFKAANQSSRAKFVCAEGAHILRVRRTLRSGNFHLILQPRSSRCVSLGAVLLNRKSGMIYHDDIDGCVKLRDTKAGAGDISCSSIVWNSPEMVRWQMWEIWALSCVLKALNRALVQGVISALKCKGAIFAQVSISVVFTGPVHWTANLTWTGLNWTEKDWTLGPVQSSPWSNSFSNFTKTGKKLV